MAYVAGPLAEICANAPAAYTAPSLSSLGRQLTRNEAVVNAPTNFTCTTATGYKVDTAWDHVNVSGDLYRLEAFEGSSWVTVQDDISSKSYQRVWSERQVAPHRVRAKRGGVLSSPSSTAIGRTRSRIVFQDDQGGPGVVHDGLPIPNAECIVYDVVNKVILARGLSDANGKFAAEELEWPKEVLVTAHPMRDSAPASLFNDEFVSLSSNWVKVGGSGTLSIVNDPYANDGKALKVDGYAVIEHNQSIAISEAGVYRISIAVRQVADPTSGGKQLFMGVSGIASDGVTRINVYGANTTSTQHYFAALGDTLAVSTTYTVFTGYFWYGGTPAGGKKPNRTAPGLLYPQAKMIRPLLYVNYQNGNGIAHIDYVTIECLAQSGASNTGTDENPAEAWHHIVV